MVAVDSMNRLYFRNYMCWQAGWKHSACKDLDKGRKGHPVRHLCWRRKNAGDRFSGEKASRFEPQKRSHVIMNVLRDPTARTPFMVAVDSMNRLYFRNYMCWQAGWKHSACKDLDKGRKGHPVRHLCWRRKNAGDRFSGEKASRFEPQKRSHVIMNVLRDPTARTPFMVAVDSMNQLYFRNYM